MDRGGEALETWILCSLPRYKLQMEKLKKAEELLKKSKHRTPTPPSSPTTPSPPPPIQEVAVEEPKESSPQQTPTIQTLRGNQIRKLLTLIKSVDGASEILQLDNLDLLIKNALSQSKKKLANQDLFYHFLFQNNLSHLVRNRHAIAKYDKAPWYLI